MKILVAPDKFKGSLSAAEACEAIGRGLRAVWLDAEIDFAPIADGGEGFGEVLRKALGGEWVRTRARDPLGREVDARYAWLEAAKLAIIEMSEASGMWRLKSSELEPLRANTFGTGQLMRDAVQRGARKIVVGLGGSATTDGGIGMAAALGYDFLTSDGDDLEAIPGNLLALIRIEQENVIDLPEIIAACDVRNPLLGPHGTARVFSPQKGADAKAIVALEEGLLNLADVVRDDLGCDFRDAEGAGAAGGFGFGLMSFCHVQMRSGFDLVAEALKLEERVASSDLIISGEGRIDAQTLEGKGPAGVAALARKHGKVILAFAGSVGEISGVNSPFDATFPIIDQPVSLDDAIRRGSEFLERAATRAAALLKLGGRL